MATIASDTESHSFQSSMTLQATQPPDYNRKGDFLQPAPSSAKNLIISPFSITDSYGFYNASGSDLLMAQHADDPNPTFYVATHSFWRSKPDVCLHAGSTKDGPIIGTADFGVISSRTTINLTPEPNGCASPGTAFEILNSGVYSAQSSFSIFVEATGGKETFKWKRSSGNEVRSLKGSSTGMKCVRCSTGETVAVMTGVRSWKKAAKMKYLGSQKGALGARAEMMVLISLLGIIVEAARQSATSAGGAAAGGGGGGGC